MNFYDKYKRYCDAIGKSVTAVAVEIGLSKSNPTFWKNNNSAPNIATLQKIAYYFGVSVDYLLGRTDNPEINR